MIRQIAVAVLLTNFTSAVQAADQKHTACFTNYGSGQIHSPGQSHSQDTKSSLPAHAPTPGSAILPWGLEVQITTA
jgi:hypothetical protein